MGDTSDLLIFLVVVSLRLFIPLAIPRFPLPAVVAAMLLDGADQSIFQQFTDLDLTSYQSYDKALDVYYLSIAYLSTLRNWTNLAAVEVSRFLLYYRLVGVVLFEYTQERWFLFIFPNTFEYFFIFYEVVRLRWNPDRMSRRVVIGAAAAIWIFIKLPQEYWIHIAQLDFTDEMEAHPELVPVIVVAVALLLVAAWWIVTRRMPPADHRPSFDVSPAAPEQAAERAAAAPRRFVDPALIEKIVLVSLVSIIFAEMLPNVDASGLQVTVAVALMIVGNTAVSEWLARRGAGGWSTAFRQFIAMAAVNVGLVVAFRLLLPDRNGSIHLGDALFFVFLLTLMVTLYDRFRPYYVARTEAAAPPVRS